MALQLLLLLHLFQVEVERFELGLLDYVSQLLQALVAVEGFAFGQDNLEALHGVLDDAVVLLVEVYDLEQEDVHALVLVQHVLSGLFIEQELPQDLHASEREPLLLDIRLHQSKDLGDILLRVLHKWDDRSLQSET